MTIIAATTSIVRPRHAKKSWRELTFITNPDDIALVLCSEGVFMKMNEDEIEDMLDILQDALLKSWDRLPEIGCQVAAKVEGDGDHHWRANERFLVTVLVRNELKIAADDNSLENFVTTKVHGVREAIAKLKALA